MDAWRRARCGRRAQGQVRRRLRWLSAVRFKWRMRARVAPGGGVEGLFGLMLGMKLVKLGGLAGLD
jgi:hypothetical protein